MAQGGSWMQPSTRALARLSPNVPKIYMAMPDEQDHSPNMCTSSADIFCEPPPFSEQGIAVEIASQLGLADLAALAIVDSVVAATFRSEARTSQCQANGADRDWADMDLVCCTLAAAECSRRGAVESMRCQDGKSVLTMAAAAGRPDVVSWLLSITGGPAMTELRDASGASALHYAALGGHSHACEVLLQNGARPDIADATGVCPLHLVAENGHTDCCRTLVEAAASVNLRDEQHESPLLMAVESRHADVCRLLAKHKADLVASSIHGRSPLTVARDMGDEEVIYALEAALWPQKQQQQKKIGRPTGDQPPPLK